MNPAVPPPREGKALYAIRFQLLEEALARAPEEACGLLGYHSAWARHRMRLYPAENAAENPESSFVLPPSWQIETQLRMHERGEICWGIFHSHAHEGGHPSERDRLFGADPELKGLHWVIVGLEPADGEPEIWIGEL